MLTCSPKIWKKFTPTQKLMWKQFCEYLDVTNSLPPDVTMTKKQTDILTHNLACHMVWLMRDWEQSLVDGIKARG